MIIASKRDSSLDPRIKDFSDKNSLKNQNVTLSRRTSSNPAPLLVSNSVDNAPREDIYSRYLPLPNGLQNSQVFHKQRN